MGQSEGDLAREYSVFMAKCLARWIQGKIMYDPVCVFATSKIDPLPYQLEDHLKLVSALEAGGVRHLLAYETGLGKTIVAGLLVKELLIRKPDARVLLVLPPMAIKQWLYEMRSKFGLVFTVFGERGDFGEKLLAASMDTLKNQVEVIRDWGLHWDLVVVDELHRATPGNKRYSLLEALRDAADNMLALTATPHDGKHDHFLGRLRLVNPAVSEENYREFVENCCFRRRKRDVVDVEGSPLFPYSVNVHTESLSVSSEEEEFYQAVERYVGFIYGVAEGSERRRPLGLVATVMGRMASSSVATGVAAMKRRRERLLSKVVPMDGRVLEEMLSELDDAETDEEREKIYNRLIEAVEPDDKELLKTELEELDRIIKLGEMVGVDSKLEALCHVLKPHVERGEKVVVFTSFVETAKHLYGELSRRGFRVEMVSGELDEDDRKRSIDLFVEKGDVLVGTEIIGESVNLQKANVVVNYELPWSPVSYIQRVGRVYRYPMRKQIFVHNFSSNLRVERRVLEIVYQKVNRLVEEFDEGSVAVIGDILTEKEVEEVIAQAYSKGLEQAQQRLRAELEKTEEYMRVVNEAISVSNAAAIHVDTSKLLKDTTEIVTVTDIQRFLEYAVRAGIGMGDPWRQPVYFKVEDTLVEELSVNDRGVKKALEMGSNLPLELLRLQCDVESVQHACVLEVEFLNGLGRVVASDVVVATPKGCHPLEWVEKCRPIAASPLRGDSDASINPSPCSFLENPGEDVYLKKKAEEWLNRITASAALKMELMGIAKPRSPVLAELEQAEEDRIRDEVLKETSSVTPRVKQVLGYLILEPYGKDDEYDPAALEYRREVELAAMRYVIAFEKEQGRYPNDVHDENLGYDIVSVESDGRVRYIEVKGVSNPATQDVTLTYNELKASNFYREDYYLYIVVDPLGKPTLKTHRAPLKVIEEILVKQFKVSI
ncbi:MAG: helicase-related protein [Thermoprotei archaeon]